MSAQPFDPRITPARPDLAASHLEGKVKAARFVEGVLREVVAPQAPLRHEPRPDAVLDTEALKGERVMVYESNEEGWSWGQLLTDGHVGYLPTEALGGVGNEPTHRLAAIRTLVFPAPSFKLPPIEALSFGCRLAIARSEGTYGVMASGGFVPLLHLAGVQSIEADFVAVAERFVGVPYLWGGRTSLGLDCSGLVQLALNACGHACPRDSDLQELSLPLKPAADVRNLARGDLVFWPGHVAIARDSATLVHANGHHMAVAIEPIAEAVARNRAVGIEVSSIRRLEGLARE